MELGFTFYMIGLQRWHGALSYVQSNYGQCFVHAGVDGRKKDAACTEALDEQALLCDLRDSWSATPSSVLKLSPLTFVLTKEHVGKTCQRL